jgi:SAM-dependent methyltransferase
MSGSMATRLSGAKEAVCRLPLVFRLQQRAARPTTTRFRAMLARHVQIDEHQRVLDVACGPGNYREVLQGRYYGCDINAAYIDEARKRHEGQFDVMDCCDLTYADSFFDHVVSIAATHHFDDAQLGAMISGALRVCRPDGLLHVVDAILPVSGNRLFKRLWFSLDVGRFPRTREQLHLRLSRHGTIKRVEVVPGPLHDCVYFQVRRSG